MKNFLSYAFHVFDSKLRKKYKICDRVFKYSKGRVLDDRDASKALAELIKSGKPLAAGRIGLFEMAVMRIYEYERTDKYQTVFDNIYNCAGFFPSDISLVPRFIEVMKESLGVVDLLAANKEACENYFINKCAKKDIIVSRTLAIFDVADMDEVSWSSALEGKKVLVVTPFVDSVRQQYENNRAKLFEGADILPKFASLETYRSLMTIGDMVDDRFNDWFEALDHMKKEILDIDFDIAILGCGAYGFPLAAEIKKAGRQAVQMGGALQILFGVMGKRWDGSRFDGNVRSDIAKYYNDSWIYPIEERPRDACKVEYGPYWGA